MGVEEKGGEERHGRKEGFLYPHPGQRTQLCFETPIGPSVFHTWEGRVDLWHCRDV